MGSFRSCNCSLDPGHHYSEYTNFHWKEPFDSMVRLADASSYYSSGLGRSSIVS